MMRFAPLCTAFWSTSSVAIDVVTTPVTTVDGSPALNVSTSSLLHSTPMFFFTRSTMSCAVSAPAGRATASVAANGVATAPTAASATKSRREISGMRSLLVPASGVPGPAGVDPTLIAARVIALCAAVMALV